MLYAIISFIWHALTSFLLISLYLFWDRPPVVGFLYSQYPWVIDFGTVGCSIDFLPRFIRAIFISDNCQPMPTVKNRMQNVTNFVKVMPKIANQPNSDSKKQSNLQI
ncbi:hypothetical protein niasHS_015379 [Heterodera schachtii]|uniref:Serpentine receptor class gamma n=1 Tax=Heterodera schachtii TaxID=97005 RepID=A0ABD2I0D9_HETSC